MHRALASISLSISMIACGPLAPPAPAATPAPPAVRLASLQPLAGDWIGRDRDAWAYRLHVEATGAFTQTITRGALGDCAQTGHLQLDMPPGWNAPPLTAGAARLAFTFEQNACSPGFAGAVVAAEVRGLDPALVIGFSDAVVTYARPSRPR